LDGRQGASFSLRCARASLVWYHHPRFCRMARADRGARSLSWWL